MSASFDAAYAETILSNNEGGYQLSHISNDKGGQTFAGIARNYHPGWYGWQLIDSGTPLDSPVLAQLVRDFFYKNFWLPINAENLPLRLAQQVFDMAVNSDCDDAAKCLQRALGVVKVDGDVGVKTISAARMSDQLKLVVRFNAQRCRHFAKTRQARDSNTGGWWNRMAEQLERGVA